MMALTIIERPSPNHGPRPPGSAIRVVVLHADAAKSEEGTLSWLENPISGVSYHYLVGRKGQVWRVVPDARRAYHAGKSAWEGVKDVNSISLGISFSNDQVGEAFTDAALAAGAELCAELCKKHHIPIDAAHITTHAEVARPPGRKTDPGKLFDVDAFRLRVCAVLVP